jgi:hypothetical protein
MGEGQNAFGFFSTKGHCVGCNAALDSSSRYCIACYRQRTRPCPECLTVRGQLKFAYKGHRGPKGEEKCPRCGVPHRDIRKITCPRCKGQHFVFVENVTA